MSHTIHLEVPGYSDAVIICNGDFSGTVHVRMWRKAGAADLNEAPDVDVDLPNGTVVALIRAYVQYTLPGLLESWLPKVLDMVVPSARD